MTSSVEQKPNTTKLIIWYSLMIGGVLITYLFIRHLGEDLTSAAPASTSKSVAPTSAPDVMLHVLLALIVIIVLARVLGSLFRAFHQPPVIGEIIAGIMLGPSVLGRLAPAIATAVLPSSVAPFLNVISQVGVILYMFLVGLELDPSLLSNRGHATVAISHASILAPFLMGATSALYLYPRLAPAGISFTSFSLFIAVSMSITAFPVLARILTDRGIHKTRMGVIALTCAAVDDVTAWCLLAVVVSVVHARTSSAFGTIMLALGFIALMIMVIRPGMGRLTRHYGNRGLTEGLMAMIFVALLLSALTTDVIGIHAIFGAFVLGAIIPHDSSLAREITDRLEDLVVVLLLPAFFAFTGLRTQIGLVHGLDEWMICLFIIVIASLGKFGGATISARLTGLGWRDASALGVLMNTRGLVELIVLNIGYDLKVIPPTLFAMLVIMALVTTFATTPILHFIAATDENIGQEGEHKRGARLRLVHPVRQSILVPVSNPEKVNSLLEIALSATASDETPPRVAAFVRRPAGGIRSGLREVEHRVAPRSQALSAALDFALERNAAIIPQVAWTEEPARDIVQLASTLGSDWILLGFHRPVFGTDYRGGTVGDVIRQVTSLPINLGIVINGIQEPIDRVDVVIDSSIHGWAGLDIATRIAQRRQCPLRVAWLSVNPDNDGEIQLMLSAAGEQISQAIETIRLTDLESVSTGNFVVVATNLSAQSDLVSALNEQQRCLIVVQGSSSSIPTLAAATHKTALTS